MPARRDDPPEALMGAFVASRACAFGAGEFLCNVKGRLASNFVEN